MELKFKILVLRLLMMMVKQMIQPSKDKGDSKNLDRLIVEVHTFIREADEFSRVAATPDRPISPAPAPLSAPAYAPPPSPPRESRLKITA